MIPFEENMPDTDYIDRGEHGGEGGRFVRCYDDGRFELFEFYEGSEEYSCGEYDTFEEAMIAMDDLT